MKYFLLCILCIGLTACNVKEQETPEENYEALFPFKGIDKPKNRKGNMTVKLCDPELALENYTYPGEDSASDAEEYTVTLTCSFSELDTKGNPVDVPTARYTVTYINEKKELVAIGTTPEDEKDEETEEDEQSVMKNGEELTVEFKVRSGFPMYLCINGVGPRDSHVKARISAVSADGLIEVPELKAALYQNDEGPNKLKHPYCEYIILP